MRCLDDYKMGCGWEGDELDCELLNGNSICPKCGSNVADEYPRIAEMMERMEELGI
jgi:hypothetical protein